MKEIIDTLIKELNELPSGTIIQFSDERYTSIPFSTDHFQQVRPRASSSQLCFIDGGNAEIFSAAHCNLQFLRIASVVYRENKLLKREVYEYYCLTIAKSEKKDLHYVVRIFPVKKKSPLIDVSTIDSFDPTMQEGKHRVLVSKIPEWVRNLLELKIAAHVIDDLPSGSILVRDGTLQCTQSKEDAYFDQLYKKALKKEVLVTGLAKTCRLMTDTGQPVTAVLPSMAPFPQWYYHPSVTITSPAHRAELFFTKLHEKSAYVFRLEVFDKQPCDFSKIIDLLAFNAQDPAFFGYPYGLLMADKAARISNQEREFLFTKFMAFAGKQMESLRPFISTLDAHAKLDSL